MSSTYPKFPNIGIDEINPQKIMGGCTFNIDVGKLIHHKTYIFGI